MMLRHFSSADTLKNEPQIQAEYNKNGIIYLANFLKQETLQSLMKEIDTVQQIAEEEINTLWQGKKTYFFSGEAPKVNQGGYDFANEDYFLQSRNKAHIFYEMINNVIAVNRIGHGMHLMPTCQTFQQLVYANQTLNQILQTVGLIKPVCQLSVYIPKYPNGIGSDVRPHQESTFAYTEPQSVVVLWITLEDALIDNACMWGILGSHRWPLQYISRVCHTTHKRRFERINDIRFPDFETERHAYTPLEVKAGDAVLFHGNFVHCSPVNTSTHSRKALSVQFIETHQVHYSEANWLQPRNNQYLYDLNSGI